MRKIGNLLSAALVTGMAIAILFFTRPPTSPRGDVRVPKQPISTPAIIEFVGFDEATGEPYAKLVLRNRKDDPIYFAGYGPTHPLQTWERLDNGKWSECGYDWCGTGRSIERLGAGQQLDISVRLRNYRTPEMPSEPSLYDYRDPMRVVLYYGLTDDDIEYPIHSQAFFGPRQGTDEQGGAPERR